MSVPRSEVDQAIESWAGAAAPILPDLAHMLWRNDYALTLFQLTWIKMAVLVLVEPVERSRAFLPVEFYALLSVGRF